MRAPTIRRLFGGGRTEEQPRSALRLFFASRFARLRGIACWWWGRVAGPNHSPPVRRREDRGTASLSAPAVFCIALCAIARHSLLVVGQGCGLQTIRRLFGGGRAEEQPRSALRLFFASRFARLRGIAAQAKKTAAVKGNGCRAPCSLSGFLHHKTPCGKYLRKKYHTMVLPVTQV